MSAVPQTIDIWSLGCVFSIAATWVVFGYAGIQQYRKVREKAIDSIVTGTCKQPQPMRTTGISAGDYFHDGRQVLEAVLDWHKVLRSALRHTDTVTSGLLDIVDQKMLLGSANMRIKATDLCSQLQKIILQSEAGPRIQMPSNIIKALLEADTDAVSLVPLGTGPKYPDLLPNPNNPNARKARKSMLLEQPLLKTAHRSEGLKSVLASYHKQPAEWDRPSTQHAVQGSTSKQTRPVPFQVRPEQFPVPKAQINTQRPFHDETPIITRNKKPAVPVPQAGKRKRTPKTHTPQDIFLAREETEKRNKYNLFGTERKDKLLTRYFGNRDVV